MHPPHGAPARHRVEVHGRNRGPEAAQAIGKTQIRIASFLSELVSDSDVILSSLADDAAFRAVFSARVTFFQLHLLNSEAALVIAVRSMRTQNATTYLPTTRTAKVPSVMDFLGF